MILILDLTNPHLSILSDEFVSPILRIVQKTGHAVHMVRIEEVQTLDETISGVILSGTALADSWYLSYSPLPVNLRKFPVLGICAGMQLLLSESGGEIIPALEIGMTPIHLTGRGKEDPLTEEKDVFSAYALHQQTVLLPPTWMTLAVSEACPQIVRHPNLLWYGVLFHPEVRNEWIIERFVDLTRTISPGS